MQEHIAAASIRAVDLVQEITDALIHGFEVSQEQQEEADALGVSVGFIKDSLEILYAQEPPFEP